MTRTLDIRNSRGNVSTVAKITNCTGDRDRVDKRRQVFDDDFVRSVNVHMDDTIDVIQHAGDVGGAAARRPSRSQEVL
jgi:hypothetical protein